MNNNFLIILDDISGTSRDILSIYKFHIGKIKYNYDLEYLCGYNYYYLSPWYVD